MEKKSQKEIKLPVQTSSRGGQIPQGSVVVAITKKVSVRIDNAGNHIDPMTKRIIKRNNEKDAA